MKIIKSMIWIMAIALVMAGILILTIRMLSEKTTPRPIPKPKQAPSTVIFSKPGELVQTTTSTVQTQAIAIVDEVVSNIPCATEKIVNTTSDVVENSTSNILNGAFDAGRTVGDGALNAGKTIGNTALGAGKAAIDAGKAVGGGAIDAGKAIGKGALDTGKAIGTGTQNAIKKATSLFTP